MSLQRIRKNLLLDQTPFQLLDNDLLLLAFTPRDVALSPAVTQAVLNKYGTKDYEFFETFGDKIFDVMIINLMLWKAKEKPKLFGITRTTLFPADIRPQLVHEYRSYVGSNRVLECLFQSRGICKLAEGMISRKLRVKECADMFEALVGVLYFYLEFILREGNTIEQLTKWFSSVWDVDTLFETDACSIPLPFATQQVIRTTFEQNDEKQGRIVLPPGIANSTDMTLRQALVKPITSTCDYPFVSANSINIDLPFSDNRERFYSFVKSRKLALAIKYFPTTQQAVLYLGTQNRPLTSIFCIKTTLEEAGAQVLQRAIQHFGLQNVAVRREYEKIYTIQPQSAQCGNYQYNPIDPGLKLDKKHDPIFLQIKQLAAEKGLTVDFKYVLSPEDLPSGRVYNKNGVFFINGQAVLCTNGEDDELLTEAALRYLEEL